MKDEAGRMKGVMALIELMTNRGHSFILHPSAFIL
jgi:hypothetical protein